jgi:hypothetical protein
MDLYQQRIPKGSVSGIDAINNKSINDLAL